jgi:hypothetical protein
MSPFTMNLLEALQRLGIALVAGILVALVPFCLGRVRGGRPIAVTTAWILSALVSAGLATAFIWYLWVNEIPHPAAEPEPAPVEVLGTL